MKLYDAISNEFIENLVNDIRCENIDIEQKYYIPDGYHIVTPQVEVYESYQEFIRTLLRAFKDKYLKTILLCYEIIKDPLVLKRVALTAKLSCNRDTKKVYAWTCNLTEEIINELLGLKDITEIDVNYSIVNTLKTKHFVQLAIARAKYEDKEFVSKLIERIGYNKIFTEIKKCSIDEFLSHIKVKTSSIFTDFVVYIYGVYGPKEESVKYIANKWKVDEDIIRHLFNKYGENLKERFNNMTKAIRNSETVISLLKEKEGKNRKERYKMWINNKFILKKAGINYKEFVEQT